MEVPVQHTEQLTNYVYPQVQNDVNATLGSTGTGHTNNLVDRNQIINAGTPIGPNIPSHYHPWSYYCKVGSEKGDVVFGSNLFLVPKGHEEDAHIILDKLFLPPPAQWIVVCPRCSCQFVSL